MLTQIAHSIRHYMTLRIGLGNYKCRKHTRIVLCLVYKQGYICTKSRITGRLW